MVNVMAVNGSPSMEKGNTAVLLGAFLEGMQATGAEAETLYASLLKIKPCTCGSTYCWEDRRGVCCIQDEMQEIYSRLKSTNILVLATPVYIPLPGAMQNFINRLMPLIDPVLVWRDERTRAGMHKDVAIQKMVWVITSGWWEKENCDTVLRIARELALDSHAEFDGALIRPHSDNMRHSGTLTPAGEAVLKAARQAGRELVQTGTMQNETLEAVSKPLISREEYWGTND